MAKKPKETLQRASENLDWRPAFLAAFAETGVVITAATAAKVGRVTVWRERRDNPDFASAFEEARQVGAMMLEEEAVRRARDGVRRLKFYEGQVIMVPDPSGAKMLNRDGEEILDDYGNPLPKMIPYVEHEYSDALLTLLLKRHYPDVYRDNVTKKVEHSGSVDGTVTHVVTAEEMEKTIVARRRYQEQLQQAMLANGRG